jgi:hypothetical protein
MKAYRQHRNSFGSRRVKHIHATNNEWVCVHRSQPVTQSVSNSGDWLWRLVAKIGGALILFVIICKILTALLPFLILGAIGWFFIVARK